MDPASLIRIAVLISIMLIVIALGMRYQRDDAGYLLRRPDLLVRSLMAMNIVMPLLALWLVSTFGLKIPVKIALVALALSPVPPFLPGKELKITTSSGYVFGLLIAASLLSVVLVPLTMSILGAHYHVPRVGAGKVLLVMLQTVLAPLAIGIVIQRLWPAQAARLAGILYKIGFVLLIVALIPVLIKEWPAVRSLIGDGTLLAIVAFTLLGLLVGHLLGGPDSQNRNVLALSTASRHPAVALAIASASFPEQRSVSAAVLLALIVGLVAAAPYTAWRKRALAAPAPGNSPSPRIGPTSH